MTHLDRYTPEICSKLRHIAEVRDWKSWRELGPEDIRIEIELTYHLHVAADATGKRYGMPPMPPCPLTLPFDDPDPASFLEMYSSRLDSGQGSQKLGSLSCN